MNGSM